MAQIYDVASKLDYSGIEAPARLNAARIAIGQQEAREAPLRFQQTQKEWKRGDEQYAQGQELFKQSQLFGKVARTIAVSQTPQTLMRNLTNVLGDDIRDPFFSTAMAELSKISDPIAYRNFQSEFGSATTNVGGLFASKLKDWEEMNKQKAITEREKYTQGEMNLREIYSQGQQNKRTAATTAATRYSADQRVVAARIRSAMQRQGLNAHDISSLVGPAQQAFANAFSVPRYVTDPETGEKRPDVDDKGQQLYDWSESRPKTQAEIDKWQAEWMQKTTHEINRIESEEGGVVAPAANPSGAKPKFSIMGPK